MTQEEAISTQLIEKKKVIEGLARFRIALAPQYHNLLPNEILSHIFIPLGGGGSWSCQISHSLQTVPSSTRHIPRMFPLDEGGT